MDYLKRLLFGGKSNHSEPFEAFSEDGEVQIHPDTHNPKTAWDKLKVTQTVRQYNIKPLNRKTPIHPDKVRFVCISDTHNRTSSMHETVPDGDVLLHAGDFSDGHPSKIEEFNTFLGTLPHQHKVVIAGNHDLTFDQSHISNSSVSLRKLGLKEGEIESYMEQREISHMSECLTNCTSYLEDSETQIYGIRIYGTPWHSWFGDWGFNRERGRECLEKWNLIPEGVDILMTHGPPLGHGDRCYNWGRAGCVELLHTIQHRVKPKYHVFGHIHEGYGISSDGYTTYINASMCTFWNKPSNPVIIFDIALPPGHTKNDVDSI